MPAGIITDKLAGVFIATESSDESINHILPLYANCDLIIVEGAIETPGNKLEVWRKELNPEPLAANRTDITAMVTEDPINVDIPIFKHTEIDEVVKWVQENAVEMKVTDR